MRVDPQVWQRWCDWITRIRADLSDLVDDHGLFEGFREVVEANGPWLDELQAGHFIDFIKRGYVTKTSLGIRRHLKSSPDSISLRRLLEQIRDNSDQITFDFYLQRFPRELEKYDWQTRTFQRLSSDGKKVSAEIVSADLSSLLGPNGDIESMVDRTLAHLDKRDFDADITFEDLRNAVAAIDKVTRRYIGFLLAEGYSSLKSTILFDWKKVFRHPWDRRLA
jgi:hypothetical protein